MEECDVQTFCTGTWSLVDEEDSLALGVFKGCSHVFGLECDMVDTSAAAVLLDEFGDCAFRAGGFEKLELHFTDLEKCSFNFLVSNLFD